MPEGREAVLYIGIHDKTGEVIGVGNTDAAQKRIRDACHGDCYPPIDYVCEVLSVDERKIVAIVIPASGSKPHFSGPAYMRVGSESPKASSQQYEELILSRVDKPREILKHQREVFTVIGIAYRLGSNEPMSDSAYRETRECRLTSCTGHLASFEDISSGLQFSEPLAHVTVTYDHARHRPKLLVTFPKG